MKTHARLAPLLVLLAVGLYPLCSLAAADPASNVIKPEVGKAVATASNSAPMGESKPLQFAIGPSNSTQLIKNYLSAGKAAGRGVGLDKVDIEKIEIASPLAIYALTDDKLPTAMSEALYYIVEFSGNPICYATIRGAKIDSVSYPPRTAAGNPPRGVSAAALGELAALDQLKPGKYEPRLLQCNFYWEVIWLKSMTDNQDLIYALAPLAPPGLKAKTIYSVDDFLKLSVPAMKSARPRS